MPREAGPFGVQFWSNFSSMETTSNECLAKVRSLLNCKSEMNVARGFRGDEAQTFIDFIDRVLARSHLDKKLRQRGLLLLSKICKPNGIVPTSYVLQEELIRVGRLHHRGGPADVSEGEYLGFPGGPVAIKCLKMNEGDSDRTFKRLCREVIGWKHLTHPNILPLLGISVSTNPHYFRILTEWMPNGDVMQYARSNPEANRLRLLSDVMSGIAYLHELKIVHGDLKGANVLVDNIGTARVMDFGRMSMRDLGTILLSETIVSSGGTLCWMSPELLDLPPGSKGRQTRESDCYALGMVIYEVLAGLRLFHRLYGYSTVAAVLRGDRPEKPHDAESLGFSHALWGLVQSCWSKTVSVRPTARDLFDHLSSISHTWDPPQVPYSAVEINDEVTTDSDPSSSLGSSLTNSTGDSA